MKRAASSIYLSKKLTTKVFGASWVHWIQHSLSAGSVSPPHGLSQNFSILFSVSLVRHSTHSLIPINNFYIPFIHRIAFIDDKIRIDFSMFCCCFLISRRRYRHWIIFSKFTMCERCFVSISINWSGLPVKLWIELRFFIPIERIHGIDALEEIILVRCNVNRIE